MLDRVPFSPNDLINWYFAVFPKRLFILGKRIVVLINNEISFTLNMKLLFTPLFGDYTKMGRLIGFVIRVLEIVFGIILVFIIAVFAFVAPVFWFALPIFIVVYYKIWFLLYLALLFILYLVTHNNIPRKKVTEVNDNDTIEAFRPEAAKYYYSIASKNKITPASLQENKIASLLKRLELTKPEFLEKITSIKIDFDDLDDRAVEYARKQKTRYIEPEHIFLSALSLVPKIDMVLATYSSSLDDCESTVDWVVTERENLSKILFWQRDYELPRMGGIGKGMTGRITPALNAVTEDFTKQAQKGLIRNIVAHKEKIEEVTTLLSSSNRNVLLIGPPGCGKTSIVKGIANNIIRGTSEHSIEFKRIVSLDTASLIAGTKTPGELSQRIKNVMDEAKASGDIILFFDEIHNLVSGSYGEESSTIFSLLEPHLTDANMQFIGATNLENYRKFIEPSGAFARLFELVEVSETSKEETLAVLKGISRDFEKQYGILITYPALREAIKLSEKLIYERVFPDKAIDVIRRTSAVIVKTSKYLTEAEVKKEVSKMTKIPVTDLSEDETQKLLDLESRLKERVIGQDHAISQIAKAMQRARVGIRNEKRPIASFLFVGTTGVGKTETAKTLASKYFGNETAMIRLDMTEYQEQDSIKRLIGDPAGNRKGILTDAIRTRPYSIILLDEIEKAYSTVLLTFLQVLDDGRLTDASGTTVDFSNSIIIATSNIGTRQIQESVDKGGTVEEMNEVAMREVKEHFAPEFLNRFSGIIVYKPLTKDVVEKITDLMLGRVRKMADNKKIKIGFRPELIKELAKRGFSKKWGARELSRVITNTVESYLALKILKGDLKMGDEIELGEEVFEED